MKINLKHAVMRLFSRGDGFPVFFILVGILVFIFSGQDIWQRYSYYFRDICLEIIPKRIFWVQSFKSFLQEGFSEPGFFGLWNPYVFFGMPFAANLQSQCYYPLNILYLLAPVHHSLNYFIFVHLWIAAGLSWLMLGEAGMRMSSRLAGALVFAFGGFIVSSTMQVVNLGSAVWLPGMVWLLLRGMHRRPFSSSIGLGLVLTIQFLAGEPEIVFISVVMLIFIGGFKALSLKQDPGKPQALTRRILVKRLAACLAPAVIIMAVLSAFQWIPALEMTRVSNRSSAFSLAEATAWSFQPRDLIQMVVPHYFFDQSRIQSYAMGIWSFKYPYIASIYCGTASLILMLLALRSHERSSVIFWWAMLVFWLILSLGQSGYLYTMALKVVPWFDRFRYPQRCALGLALASSWLAALGMEWFNEYLSEGSRTRPPVYIILFMAAMAIVLGGILISGCECASQEYIFSRSLLRTVFFANLAFLVIWSFDYFSSFKPLEPLKKAAPLLLLALIFLDLYTVHRNLNPMIEDSFYQSEPGVVKEMSLPGPLPPRALIMDPLEKADRYIGRDENPEEHYTMQREWLQPFVALSYGINDISARSSFYLRDIDEAVELTKDSGSSRMFRFLARSATDWLFVPGHGLRDVPGKLPRAMVVYNARVIPDRKELLDTWLSEDFDAEQVLLLEKEPDWPFPHPSYCSPEDLAGHPAEVIEYSNERVLVEAEASCSGFVLLLDTYYPGWIARDNGEPAEVHRANGFFRAVEVPEGEHRIEFIYHPESFLTGCKISLSGLIFILLLITSVHFFKRNRET